MYCFQYLVDFNLINSLHLVKEIFSFPELIPHNSGWKNSWPLHILYTADGLPLDLNLWLVTSRIEHAVKLHGSCFDSWKRFSQCLFHISLLILEISSILLCNCIYLCKIVSLASSVNKSFKSSIFCGIMWCSLMKVHRHFTGTCHLHLQGWRKSQTRNRHEPGSKRSFTQVSCLAYSLTMKMEAACSCETLIDIQWTVLRYIPKDRSLPTHCCENSKFYKKLVTVIVPSKSYKEEDRILM
jgi:hypothetical protein